VEDEGPDAHRFYGAAKSYVQAAFVMMSSPDRLSVPNDLTFFYPLHMLWGFATELYLKAYLIHRGASVDEVSVGTGTTSQSWRSTPKRTAFRCWR
jgi:hypothetical protein